jgi:hypothetical protein
MIKRCTDKEIEEGIGRLKEELQLITDSDEKQTKECLIVVLSAILLGTDVDTLVQHTGYSRDFMEVVSYRMRVANIWVGACVSDEEECGFDEETYVNLLLHAYVAKGSLSRRFDHRDQEYVYFPVKGLH